MAQSDDYSRVVAINDMINKYSMGLPGRPISRPASQLTHLHQVALLTGSTGNLGSQILVEMVLNDRFTKIYAFNRPGSQSIFERHKRVFDDRGLDTTLLTHPTLVYVCGDTSQASLGLTTELYEEIRSSVTLIVHNAWTLGLTPPLASFEENIRGARHLIDFALSGPHRSSLRFLFTSSLSSAFSWKHEDGPLPEEIILDPRIAVGIGYGESKYVTERILASSGLQSCSIRISQISGSAPRGSWPTSEWIPNYIKTCIDLKCFPISHGVVSWIPMDIAARSIVDVSLAACVPESVLNLVHPRPVVYASLIELVGRELSERDSHSRDVQYPLVPIDVWISRVITHLRQASSLKDIKVPNVKMMKFIIHNLQAEPAVLDTSYECGGLPVASTDRMQLLSPSLRQAEQIGRSDIQRWLDYWESIGFLDRRSEGSIVFAKL